MMYVYILRCNDNSYYTGVTNNMEARLEQHQNATDPKSYTASRLPVELVFCERVSDPEVAIRMEKQLKGWSRKKKEALIRGEFELLPRLSRRGFKPSW